MNNYLDFKQEVLSTIREKGLPYLYELVEIEEKSNNGCSTKKLPRYRAQFGLSEEEFRALRI